jgi:hypothetical protein
VFKVVDGKAVMAKVRLGVRRAAQVEVSKGWPKAMWWSRPASSSCATARRAGDRRGKCRASRRWRKRP